MSNTLINCHIVNDNSYYNLYRDYGGRSIAIQDLGTRHRQWSLHGQFGCYNEISRASPEMFLTRHMTDRRLKKFKFKLIGIDFQKQHILWNIIIDFIKNHRDLKNLEFVCCFNFNDDMWNRLYDVLVTCECLRKFTINSDCIRPFEMSDTVYQKYRAFFYRDDSNINFRVYNRQSSY